MFELTDGRDYAYQWDTGLYVDCTGLAESDEVHFYRPSIMLALHPAMQGETLVAPVPDELLQQAQPIIVFAYVQTATGEITRVSTRLCVIARPKPPGYIASPTEALRWGHLQEQIGDLADLHTQDKTSLVAAVNEAMTQGGAADPEAVQQIVEDYLAENPPTVAETDPTVPEWAKAAQKPSYTASEVGADPSGAAASQVSAHNTGADAHSDIRLLISGLTDRLNALADSDDTTLDQLSEVVAYIKSNRELIASITTDKVSVADIVDNLTTNVANKPLSAAQGVALKALIDAISIPDKLPNPNALTFTGGATGSYDGSAPLEVEIPSGGGAAGDYIPIPASAEVGQTIVVKAVDEDGKPTEWEAADMPSGGGEEAWDYEKTILIEEEVASLTIDTFDDGTPLALKKVEVILVGSNATSANQCVTLTPDYDSATSGGTVLLGSGPYLTANQKHYLWGIAEINNGEVAAEFAQSNNQVQYINFYNGISSAITKVKPCITYSRDAVEIYPRKATKFISIKAYVPAGTFAVGTILRIKGVMV